MGPIETLVIIAVAVAVLSPLLVRTLDGLRGRHAQRERRVGEDEMRLRALADGEAPVRSSTEAVDHRVGAPQPTPTPLPPATARAARIHELEQRYVADEISVEEYERELDKVLRKEEQDGGDGSGR